MRKTQCDFFKLSFVWIIMYLVIIHMSSTYEIMLIIIKFKDNWLFGVSIW